MKAEISKNVDPNTGETVSKCNINDDFKQVLDKALNQHNIKTNNFMVMSQQYADLMNKWLALRKELEDTNKHFSNKMKYIAKKLKLSESEPWSYNMQEKCFELREPPPLEPMTANQLNKPPTPDPALMPKKAEAPSGT